MPETPVRVILVQGMPHVQRSQRTSTLPRLLAANENGIAVTLDGASAAGLGASFRPMCARLKLRMIQMSTDSAGNAEFRGFAAEAPNLVVVNCLNRGGLFGVDFVSLVRKF